MVMENNTVKVHTDKQSDPVVIRNVFNCYQKGDMYCVAYEKDGQNLVQKFPMRDDHIFRIKKPYNLEGN